MALRLERLVSAPACGATDEEILRRAASLAAGVKMGFSSPLEDAVQVNKMALLPTEHRRAFPEKKGVSALVRGIATLLGEPDFVLQSHLEIPETLERAAALWAARGRKIIFIGWEAKVRAFLVFEKVG